MKCRTKFPAPNGLIYEKQLKETDYRTIQKRLEIKVGVLLILCLAIFVGVTDAQDAKEDETIKIDTLLVNVPVIASDKEGRYIAGLKKENFFIVEDGAKRSVDFFVDEAAPMNVAILIDTSYSTRDVLIEIADAAHDFVKTLRPEDKGMIVSFDYEMTVLTDFTPDRKKLSKAINRVRIADRGGSNMQDAMYKLVTDSFASVKGRKAIIVLTDGAVSGRIISNQKLLYTLAEADVLVYPILFKVDANFSINFHLPKSIKLSTGETISAEEFRKRVESAQNKQLQFMNALGTVTGGRLYDAGSTNFRKTFQNISDELKKQYVVGFYPTSFRDGKPHRIAIEVNPKNIVIRTKRFINLKLPTEKP